MTSISRANADLLTGLHAWPAWSTLAWNDIQAKYRRTMLGPLWITAGIGTTILIMGWVYPALFGIPPQEYIPYLTAGFLAWFFILNLITESANIFINASGMIKQVKIPLSFFVFQYLSRNAILFVHNFLIYVFVSVLFEINVGVQIILIVPAIAIYLVTGFALGILFGTIGARFRDIPQLVVSAMQIVFFLTPIFWHAGSLPGRGALVICNPFYHYIEILRQPLLGGVVAPLSWLVAVGCATVICALAWWILVRFRDRVVFWV